VLGLMAAMIGVCGFLAHMRPALSGDDERRLREATATGGAIGAGLALLLIVLSALID
jgi:hypothetical protein